jgi:hypothetical protein
MEYVFQLIKTLGLNNLPAVISALALLVSVISFIWNRQHAKTLFRATQYPDLDFSFDFKTFLVDPDQPKRMIRVEGSTPRELKREIPLPHNVSFKINWSNKTNVAIVNLHARLTLTRGLSRVRWNSSELRRSVIHLLENGEDVITEELKHAMAEISPESLVLCKKDSAPYIGEWLEVLPGEKPIELGLCIELSWQPPLFQVKLLKTEFARNLELRIKDGGWVLKPRLRIIPTSLYRWRPRTMSFLKPNSCS